MYEINTYPLQEKRVMVGNFYSSIAVILPTFQRKKMEKILEKLDPAFIMALDSRLFKSIVFPTNFGLLNFLQCVLVNPNIDTLIVFSESGFPYFTEFLEKLKHDEVQPNLPCGLELEFRAISHEIRDLFRKQIKNVVKTSNLNDLIEFSQKSQNFKRKKLSGRTWKPNNVYTLPSVEIMKKRKSVSVAITEETISKAYRVLVNETLNKGLFYDFDQGGREILELLNVIVLIINPLQDPIPFDYSPYGPNLVMDRDEIISYLDAFSSLYQTREKSVMCFDDSKWIIKPEERLSESASPGYRLNYSNSLKNHEDHGQLRKAIDAISLSISKTIPSRRIMLSLLNPLEDFGISEAFHPPGLVNVQFFPRPIKDTKKWKLDGTFYIRSHDVLKVFPANAYASAKLLEYTVKEVNLDLAYNENKLLMGSCRLFFGSAHIFLSDLKKIDISLS
ncbi:MAG: hypothetical protein ACFFAU_17255 [Candidatus Hodarchaeota archaeon]